MGKPTGKITTTLVTSMVIGQELRDPELRGFGARRQEGAVVYFVQCRIKGKSRRLTIGRHGSPWTAETARKEAAKLLMTIRAGGDPAKDRDERRVTGALFETVGETFLEQHGRKLKSKTVEDYRRHIRGRLASKFTGKALDEITPQMVARAHASWNDAPRSANYSVAVLSKLMTWAYRHGYRKSKENPCEGIEWYRENKRERYLTLDELERLGTVLSEAEAAGEDRWMLGVARMLILTGARLGEMLTLKWEYLDREKRLLRLPDSKTGAKVIHLSSHALALLDALPRIEGNPWVFRGKMDGSHLVNMQKPWRTLRKKAGIHDVRLHDLRHSFASIAIDVGGSLPIIGKLLGHTQPKTTSRYAHVAPSPALQVADAAGEKIVQTWTQRGAPSEGEYWSG